MPRVALDAVYYLSQSPIDGIALGTDEEGRIGQHPECKYVRFDQVKVFDKANNPMYVGRFIVESPATVLGALNKMDGVTVLYPLHRPIKADVAKVLGPICGADTSDYGEDALTKLQSTFTVGGFALNILNPADHDRHRMA